MIRNFITALKDQGPPARFLRNLFTFRIRSVFHPHSHWRRSDGKIKVTHTSKQAATAAATSMHNKTGAVFGTYKCFYCTGYHIGKNSPTTAN